LTYKTKSKIKLKSENTELIQKIESMASREGEGEATRGVNDNRRASSLSRYDEAQALGGHGVVGDVSSPQRYQSFSYREQDLVFWLGHFFLPLEFYSSTKLLNMITANRSIKKRTLKTIGFWWMTSSMCSTT